ncbi:hypothetical protein [Glycomyces paridis]|uniref:Uncharacterized protein n=1 Tax=Glycomyces paridis TaxID=2126555 RepID=A0A4S8NVL6_9ACTN|nr:hypothetical protein [Glycomyces paridis]THV21677.1 hypothetical protein E9998_24655 [Glycomyces paridis]
MIELVLWHEPVVPPPAEAEQRYQRIRADKAPLPLRELDQRFQDFITAIREHPIPVRFEPVDHFDGEPRYSRHGLLVTFADENVKRVHPEVGSAAIRLRMHLYDRRRGSLRGVGTDPDLTVR